MSREGVFWGWGEAGAGPSLPDHAAGFLRSALGVEGAVVSRPVALAEVRLSDPQLPGAVRERLAAIVGEAHVRDDAAARVGRCRGKSYLDLLRQRAGDCEDAPDAVVAPGDAREAQQVIYACSEEGIAVVPYGGGTSVVGGLEPLRGRFGALISLDLGRLEGLESFDERSHTAWLGGGTRLPEADNALGQRGYTLAHTPQSYEWATVGGCVATRSAGQSSTGHGRIEDNVVAVRCATPAGELATLAVPATAAGPSLKQLVIGSEGTLGVITSVGLRVFPRPAAQRYEGWFVHSFAEGADMLRRLVQAGIEPDVARLSDEAETGMGRALGGAGGLKGHAGRALLRARGYASGCLVICGWEDDAAAITRRRGPAARLLRRAGAMPVGEGAGPELARLPLRRPAPARRPARPRRARRDARDRDQLVEPRDAEDRGDARARGRAAPRRSSSATSPTSTPPAPRSTSRRWRRRTPRIPPASGRRRSAPRRTRSSRPAARSRTTTPSAPTTRPGCPRSSARSGTTSCGWRRSAATRPG